MIFLTVGTTKFTFNRLIKAVARILLDMDSDEKLVAQIGPNNYRFKYKNKETFSEAAFDKMVKYLSRARVVIGHGGFGTSLLGITYSKNKPLVVPRSKEFGEHVDDHQIYLAKYLAEKELVKVALPNDDLESTLLDYLAFPPKNNSKKLYTNKKMLIENLTKYTERIK